MDIPIATFRSRRRIRGKGWLGRNFKTTIMPLISKAMPYVLDKGIPFLQKQLLKSAGETVDLINKGEPAKEAITKSMIKRGIEAVENGAKAITEKGYKRLRQTGGKKRKKKLCCKRKKPLF